MAVEQGAIGKILAFGPGEKTVWPGDLDLGEVGQGRLVYRSVTFEERGEQLTGRIVRQPALAVVEGDKITPFVYESDITRTDERLVLQVLDRIQAHQARVSQR